MVNTASAQQRTTQRPFTLIRNLDHIDEMVEAVTRLPSSSYPLFFDVETTGYKGSDIRTDKPVSLQFMCGGRIWIADVRRVKHLKYGSLISPVFNRLVVGHNIKFDLEIMMLHFGVQFTQVWDTQIAEQVLKGLGLSDADKKGVRFGLQFVAERYGMHVSKEERETFKNMHLTPAWKEPFTPEQLDYMAQDVEVLQPIMMHQGYRLVGEDGEDPLYDCFKLEQRVTPALAHMELSGVLINQEGWRSFIQVKEREAKELEDEAILIYGNAYENYKCRKLDQEKAAYEAWEQARDLALQEMRRAWEIEQSFNDPPEVIGWGDFKVREMRAWREANPNPGKPKEDRSMINLDSPTQLKAALDELGIPAKNTSKGTLEDLKERYPEVALLLGYRKAEKFVQSFGESLLQKISIDGRIHPNYIQIGASTNRMSCTDPNWQQQPARGDGKELRRNVVAPEGYKILVADFGSQELCIIAELSGDENLLGIFERGEDPHSATARLMFNLGPDVDPRKYEVAPGITARDAAKTINYGLSYGMTEYGLAHRLGVSVEKARELMDLWYAPYPGIKQYFHERKDQIWSGEFYSTTLHGWKRRYEPLPPEPLRGWYKMSERNEYYLAHREWETLKRKLENKSMNTPVQGSGAGVTKLALALIFERLILNNAKRIPVRIIASVHDENVLEAPEEHAEWVAGELARCMDDAMAHFLKRVKFPKTEVHISNCWEK